MNHGKTIWLALIASLAFAPMSWAQFAAPAGAAGAAPAGAAGVAGVGAPTAPAAPGNLWSFLLPNADQKAACKTCFCNSPLGQLTSGGAGPMAMMSGGMIKNRCAQNALLDDLKKPADSPAGAAAKIKADEADAKERRANVRYLGTVDCNRWPEAIAALKLGLRADRNECVRYESALALRNGCCCKNEIIKALEICVTGGEEDGFPAEHSDRVRAAAAEALMRCPILVKEKDKKEDKQKITDSGPVDPTDYYKKVSMMAHEKVMDSARAVLASMQKGQTASNQVSGAGTAAPAGPPMPAIHERPNGLAGIVTKAFSPNVDASGARQPFFAGLTKTLTGSQDSTGAGRQEQVVAAGTTVVKIRETKTVAPIEIVAPMPNRDAVKPREPRTIVPADIMPPMPKGEWSRPSPREIKTIVPADIMPPMPIESSPPRPREIRTIVPADIMPPAPIEPSLGKPRETKGMVEIIQTAPTAPTASPAVGAPRESRGVVTMEPEVVLPAPTPRR